MNLEVLLKDLRTVKGYKGSGITNYTGEVLAGDVADQNTNIPLIAAMTNDIFLRAHDVAERHAGAECDETNIIGRKTTVLMRCTGPNSKAHLHIGCVIAADGNTALARMIMAKIATKAVEMMSK